MTFDEAKKVSNGLNNQMTQKLCPLIIGKCSEDCVCFLPAELVDDDTNDSLENLTIEEKSNVKNWDVLEPICRCYFLFGRR